MDAAQFLAQRTKNARFHNERRVTGVHSGHAAFDVPSVGAWYSAPKRESGLKRTVETFAMKKGEDGKMHPTEGETSDNSDAGAAPRVARRRRRPNPMIKIVYILPRARLTMSVPPPTRRSSSAKALRVSVPGSRSPRRRARCSFKRM